ncbi:MAG: hypothetical protein RBU21_20405 [FCB group bacterium]|jgi:hypothetical protein|nr:hypothetical protein [FCB group bacterium]
MSDPTGLDLATASRLLGVEASELERLARKGIVARSGGLFDLVGLVRSYVGYLKAETDRVRKQPTQGEIAAHLDMSERNVRELLGKLGVNHRSSTLDEVRVAYIRYLRELAAGRGGEDQYDLTKQKARQAEADARLKELDYWERVGVLVNVEELEPLLAGFAALGRAEFENALEKIVAAIESKHGVEIEEALIAGPRDDAYRAIAAYPSVLGDDAGGDGEGV